MKEYKLNIGELRVTKNEAVTYTCLGLGSCIGLFIQDRAAGLSGGAHILLPEKTALTETDKYFCVKSAVSELITRFRNMGSNLATLRAKITGGANVTSAGAHVGEQNTTHVLRELIQHKVYIAALDVGGRSSRTAKFDANTGTLTVRMAETNEYKIY